MSLTIAIAGGIYYDPDHSQWSSEYKFFGGDLGAFSQYVPVIKHDIEVTLPADWQPQVAEIAALQAMREEAHKKFAETVKKIDLRISKLLAISNEVPA